MNPAYTSSYEYDIPKVRRQSPSGGPRFGGTFVWLKRFALGLFALIALLMVLGWLFRDEITQNAINALNNELKTEVKITDIDLSLLRSFPKGSVVMQQVSIQDLAGKPLLLAAEIDLDFNLLSLFGNRIVLDEVTVKNGVLRLLTDANGQTNYDIAKSAGEKKQTKAFELDIRNARLIEVELLLDDKQVPYTLSTRIHDGRFLGRFGSARFAVASEAKLMVHQFVMDKKSYLADMPIEYETVLTADLKQNAWQIKKGLIGLDKKNAFSIDGMAVFGKKATDLDLRLNASKGDISLLMHLLPPGYAASMHDIKSTGAYHCKGTIKGRLSKTTYPEVQLAFGMANAKITHSRLVKPLQKVNFDGTFLLKPNGDGYLRLPNFQADYAGAPMAVLLTVQDFRNPLIDLKAVGKLSLQTVGTSTNDQVYKLDRGNFDLRSLVVHGAWSDMQSPALRSRVDIGGEIYASDIAGTIHQKPYQIPSSHLLLQGGTAKITDTKILIAGSDFSVTAQINAFLPWLMMQNQQEGSPLQIQADITSNMWSIDQFLALFPAKASESQAAKHHSNSRVGGDITADVNLKVKALTYDKVVGTNIQGQINLTGNRVRFKANGNCMQGQVALAGSAKLEERIKLELNAGLRSIDLKTCFAQTNSFGQEVITDKHISGTMTGRAAITACWSANGVFLEDQLIVHSDIIAHNGSLKNVKTFEDFSDYLRIADLRDLHFTTLQNYIEVRNGSVYLPAMFIRNNACNLTISGVHQFDQKINYFMKINAGQALFNRIRKPAADGEVLSSSDGLVNLYYTMTGDMDNYQINRSKQSVRRAFDESTSRKKRISDAIEEAFAHNTPEFQTLSPLREIPEDEPHSGQPDIVSTDTYTDSIPTSEEEKPKSKPKRRALTTTRQSSVFPSPHKISQAYDDEYLDVIVGGN